MTCKICGKKLPEGSTVCPYCGTKAAAPRPRSGDRRSKKGKARQIILTVILLLLSLAVIGGVIYGIVWAATHIELTLRTPETQQEEPKTPEEPTGEPETPKEPEKPEESEKSEEPGDEPVIPPEDEKEDEPVIPPEEQKPEEQDEPVIPPEEPPEEETPTAPVLPQSLKLNIDRTEITASLDHYRDLIISLSEALPEGISVTSVVWSSSDAATVRPDPQKDVMNCRAWGVKPGKATVTATVTFSTGDTRTASCVVTAAEKKQESSKPAVSAGSDYILPDSASRVYTVEELRGLTGDQLILARNEIFARHGRIFESEWLRTYFSGKSWYSGTVSPADFDASVLNAAETKNISVLAEAEKLR